MSARRVRLLRALTCMGLAALFLTGSASCARSDGGWTMTTPAPDSAGTPIRITGVVKHLGVEGGVFAIVGDDGVTYNPTNLPAEFRKDGMTIEAEGMRRDDVASIQMIGPVVQLSRVRPRTP